MSEFKGVPGPWTIGVSTRHGIHCVDAVDPKDGLLFEVCEVWGIDHNAEETQRSMANAQLIAAAPDLLEALAGLYDAYCRAGDDLTRDERTEDRKRLIAARAAISLALGE